MDIRKVVYEMADKAVKELWGNQLYWQNVTAWHVYYKASGPGAMGDIRISNERIDGYLLARPERVSCAATREQIRSWIIDSAQRLPILAY